MASYASTEVNMIPLRAKIVHVEPKRISIQISIENQEGSRLYLKAQTQRNQMYSHLQLAENGSNSHKITFELRSRWRP